MLRPDEMQRLRTGDEDFFRHLYERFELSLRAEISRIVHRPDDVDDVLQDTWARVFERRATFSNRGSLEGWLRRICRSICVDWLRAERKRVGIATYWLESDSESVLIDAVDSTQDHRDVQHLYELVRNELAVLPDLQFEIAIYRWLLGYSTKQSAARAHVAVGTVKAALHQVRLKIRAQLPVRATKGGWELDSASHADSTHLSRPSRSCRAAQAFRQRQL